MTTWKHTGYPHKRFAYVWRSNGKGHPRTLIVRATDKLETEMPLSAFMKQLADKSYGWETEPTVTLDVDYAVSYETDVYYLFLEGVREATPEELATVLKYEAEVKNTNRQAKEYKEAKERAEYERLSAIYGEKK